MLAARWPRVACCTRRRTWRPPRWPGGWRGSDPPPRSHGQAVRPARWRTRAKDPAPPCRPGPARQRAGHQANRPPLAWCGRPPGPAAGHAPDRPSRYPPGRCCPSRPQEARLVQPERGHTLHSSGVLDQRSAVLTHRPHHRRPANPQVAGSRRDRMGVPADSPAGLGAGPLGQHRPRSDPGHPLGPGPHPTRRHTAAPDPLAPARHHQPAADRQVAHPNRPAAVRGGPYAAARTADHPRRRLDRKLPLATHQLRRDDLQVVQVQRQRP
jgi:hypothetical protein